MRRIGRPHSGQLAGPVQPRQRDRVAPVRLNPLAGALRDQSRSDHQAIVAERPNLAIKPAPRRPGLKADMQSAVALRQSLDRPLDRSRPVFDLAEKPDFPVRPPSASATACFFLATSKATKTSLCFPMVRPPCMRLGSACPSNPRFSTARKGGPPAEPANMTSSSPDFRSAIDASSAALAPPRNSRIACA